MKIEKVTLTNFRNYVKQTLNLGSGIHFIIGANGEGKTNFLEAFYVLALAKSYRVEDVDLIRYGEDFAKINAMIDSNGRNIELTLVISEIGKKAIFNNSEMKRLSDYIGNLNIVAFLPENMALIKGSPRERRYYVDVFLGQIDRNYLDDLSKYKHILKQRNELLKRMAESRVVDETLLDVITEQLTLQSDRITSRRNVFVKEANLLLDKAYHKLAGNGDRFTIEYLPSITSDDSFAYLKTRYKQDILAKASGFGPHRDDYGFLSDDHLARNRASQGEQRTMILALNMVFAEMVYQAKKERPVFLLDDVFSELDQKRQHNLLEYLEKSEIQTIITSTTIDTIDRHIREKARIFHVEKGYIKEDK